jgi:hypothetical protein
MIRGRNAILSVAVLLVGVLGSELWAQRPVLRTPSNRFGRPPVYDLFRENTGILPNYYQFYRPRQQLQQTLQMQDYQLQRQDGAIRSMQNQWRAAEQRGSIAPTGTGSRFMDTTHFYPGLDRQR